MFEVGRGLAGAIVDEGEHVGSQVVLDTLPIVNALNSLLRSFFHLCENGQLLFAEIEERGGNHEFLFWVLCDQKTDLSRVLATHDRLIDQDLSMNDSIVSCFTSLLLNLIGDRFKDFGEEDFLN